MPGRVCTLSGPLSATFSRVPLIYFSLSGFPSSVCFTWPKRSGSDDDDDDGRALQQLLNAGAEDFTTTRLLTLKIAKRTYPSDGSVGLVFVFVIIVTVVVIVVSSR